MSTIENNIELQKLEEKYEESLNKYYELHEQKILLEKQLNNTLWNYCVPYHPELNHIPPLKDTIITTNTHTQIGDYILENIIGKGQFATVKKCKKSKKINILQLNISINYKRIPSH